MKDKMIPLFSVFMSPSAGEEVNKVLYSGFIGQGAKVEEYEEALKSRFNTDWLATTNSATSAEHLAFHLLKKQYVPSETEVLVTALSCTATHFPVLANGYRLKWVDIDPNTINIDYTDLERKLSPSTKIIYLVHWGGMPHDLDRINKIRNKCSQMYGFFPTVIEDCAHALGSKYKGKPVGSHGNICTFSTQAIKHVTSVDGGFLISNNPDMHRRAKLLRWYGIDREEKGRKDFRCEAPIPEWGFKFHMNDVMATVGLCNLKYADEIIGRHKANAAYYDFNLRGMSGVTLTERREDMESSFWIYPILVEDRANFMKAMADRGVMTSQVHERVDKHPCVAEYRSSLPNLDQTIGKLVHIPVHQGLLDKERSYVVECIKRGW